MTDPALAALASEHPEAALRARFVVAGGRRLHVVEAGPEDGPPVLLLHGFPEFWWGWRRQLPALATAGWRAVAPDLPGYNLSDKPRGLSPYGLDALTDVVADLLAELGPGAHPVFGHDWGGAVAWWGALRFPERISRLRDLERPAPGGAARRAAIESGAAAAKSLHGLLPAPVPPRTEARAPATSRRCAPSSGARAARRRSAPRTSTATSRRSRARAR